MINILYHYFLGKIILIALIIVFIYFYRNKKVHLILFILGIIFISVLGYFEFRRPSIINSIKLYNEFVNLTPEEVKSIILYEDKTVVYRIKDNKKAEILTTLKQNESYMPNHPVYINTYLLEINTYNYDDKIYFEINETDDDNGVLVRLLNYYNGELQPIGVYQNNDLLYNIRNNKN
jgi:cell division protein FtsW (lipid II flippase)